MAKRIKLDEALRIHLYEQELEMAAIEKLLRTYQQRNRDIWESIKKLHAPDLEFHDAVVQDVEKENGAILVLPFEDEITEGEGK